MLRASLTASLHDVPQGADPFDLDLDDVARFEVLGRRPGEADARGSSGDDDVSGPKLAPSRYLGDQARDLEHHEARTRILLHDAVDSAPDREVGRVDLVGGDDPRAKRQGGVGVLSLEPLPGMAPPHVAGGD